ncbi:mucin-4 isoform X3 [Cuculus canorus]|uniref:mucin-4 isoform X3 n=1 Tax=Cuculus canorus TaxID=55661 RepID=UPI0023AAEAE5|nr:mucin-4 isoform X3 [Cuculus canorus]
MVGCDSVEPSVPQAGHVAPLSQLPRPGGVLTDGATLLRPTHCIAPLEELQPRPCCRRHTMELPGQWLLWSWMLWGLWVLPAQGGETGEQPLAPVPAPAEPGSFSSMADSTSVEVPPDLGMCQVFPTTTATQPEHPSPRSSSTSSAGSPGSGSLVPQVTMKAVLPARSSGEQGTGLAIQGRPQSGVPSPGAGSHPTNVPLAPTSSQQGQLLSLSPTGHEMGLAKGGGGAGPAAATSAPAPGVLAVMGTSKSPSNSSTAPKQALEVSRVAPDSIPGEPVLGTTVPMQKGIAANPPMGAAGAVRGAPPAPGQDLSMPAAHVLAAQPVPGTKASSSVTGKLTDVNELVQLGNAVTVKGMPGTMWTTAPLLSQDEHSTGVLPPIISENSDVPHTTAWLPSQEVMPGLDKTTSPPDRAASISQDTGSTVKPAAASASPATGLPGGPAHTATEGARMAAPPPADPRSAPTAKVAFSSAITGVNEATEPPARALSDASHNALQVTPVPPAEPPPALSPQHPTGAVLDARERPSTSHSAAPSIAGDGLPGANAVTHAQATALALGTSAMVMDVTAAEDIPTTSFPAPGSTDTELVSIRSEPSTKAIAGTTSLETKAIPEGLSMGLSLDTAPDGSGGPSPGSFVHSMWSLVSQTPPADPGATTAEAGSGRSPPARPSTELSLSLTGSGGAKPDGDPQATAAPTSSYGVGTGPAARPSSISNTTISEAGVETASLTGGKTTTMLWDNRATLAAPDASLSSSQPGPTVGSAPLGTDGTPGPAPVSPIQVGPQHRAAPRAEMSSLSAAPGTDVGVPGTLRGPRATSIPVTSQADIPSLLEGSTTAEMALRMSPSSISAEAAAGMFSLVPATPPPAMVASSDPHPDGSIVGPLVRMVPLEVGTEENPDADAAGPTPSHAIVTVWPSTEPLAQGTDDSETRPPADLLLPAPRGNHSSLSPRANLSLALAEASPLPNTTTGKTLQPVTLLHPKNAAREEEMDRSQPAGDGSTTQAALGSTPAENTRVGAVSGTPYSGDTALETSLQTSLPAAARSTAQPSTAASDHSYLPAEPTTNTDVGMDLNKDTASPTSGNRAVGLPLGLPSPSAGSARGSKSPTAVAIMDTVSPTAPELVMAPSSGLTHSTTEQDIHVSPPVPGNAHPVVMAPSVTPRINVTGPAVGARDDNLNRVTTPPSTAPSSSSTLRRPRVTLRPPREATNSIHDPISRTLNLVTEDEPTARVTLLDVGHRHGAWEATTASQSGAEGTIAWADTTASERSTEGAAPPAGTNSVHAPVSNTTSTSLATMAAVSIFASKTILPPTSAGGGTFVVTRATAAVPIATAKATSTSRALAVTHDEAGGGGRPVLSPAVHTPSVETAAESWGGPATTLPASPRPSPHSPGQDTATVTSLLGVGTTRGTAAGKTLPEPATDGSSPTAISNRAVGRAATTSPPSSLTSIGATAWGEKTATTAGSTMTITESRIATIAEGSTMTITESSIATVAEGSTMTIAEGSNTTTTAGSIAAITEDSTTTIAGGNTMIIAEGSTMTTTAGSTMTKTEGSTTSVAGGSTMTVTAGRTMTITAGNTTANIASSTMAITADITLTNATGNTTAVTAGSITTVTAGSTVAVAPSAPVSPDEQAGGLPAPGTVIPGRPPASVSPATTPAHSFGTEKGPSTASSTSAHATAGHKNPAPQPQPTHRIIMPAASLYPFGMEAGDQECIQRMVDFNSPLFKPEIGFPFGMSLRDALYFTDNGQIIFPPTENYVPSNPNPPPQGFSSREDLPVVAVFWDDADFSQGVGTTWYQEYSTISSTKEPLVRDVEAKIEKYLKIPYNAKWTLKVTWEKAPAYPSQQHDTQTSTYQAVLTTDGNHSFALLLYQDGGMRWDYTELAAGNVLIGFSSGDGYAQNNELTQKPPAVKYRPDQHSSTSTDVRGLWIYRLDSRSRVNFRLKCLAWLDTQPAPGAWNSELLPCPCSQPQAELDPRYRWSRGPEDASVRILRTTSPSLAGAGVRCLYQDGSLLEGWQERTWTLPIHLTPDEELEAFDWCCRRVGKPLFCTKFAEKRPRVGCEGYVPPTPASAFGDPHITTLDGLTYTFNGLGDFVLLLASDARTSFVLQGRTARTGTAQATNFMAFAAQYTSTTTTAVEWSLGSQGDIQVLLNNKTIQFSYSQDMGAKVYYSPGVLLVNGSSITAVFDGAIAVSISAGSGILSMVCSLPNQYHNSTKGLLGVWDHDPTDDFQMLNGTSIPVNSSEEEIYSYGMTWAVGEHSLFAPPLDSSAMNFTPIFLSQLRQENESQYQLAALQCHGSKECIYDSLSTGDVALGLATQSLTVDFQQKKTLLNAFPPVITGDASLTAFRTERVSRQYHATGAGAHFVPHLSTELNISESGTLTWEPRGTAPLTVSLEAVGSNNLSALLQLHFTLCSCRRSQECDYSDTVTLEGSSLQLAACRCDGGYSGPFCQDPPDPCAQGCFPGVGCNVHTGCGPCPAGLTGDGRHCSDIDECAQGMACPGNTNCTNTVGSYICTCPASEDGEGPDCGSACDSRSCPEGYCSNGGHCHLHPLTCSPTCSCHPAFTDQRCLVAGGDFRPLPSTDLPRRSIQLQVRTMQNATAEEVNDTVSAILDSLEVKVFQSNTNITRMTEGDGFTFRVVSEFAYDSRGTVIHFLNKELPGAIINAFNGRQGRREARAHLLFQRLHHDNITDLVKLTVAELRRYFPCGLYGYKGYQLHYTGTIGFVCISPCKMGYCQHGGQCQHLPKGPMCSCLPFSIFSPGGTRCERLAISLAAFLGILVGTLALLCLLFTTTCLALHLCRQHHHRHWGTKETFWRSRPFSSLMTAEEQTETSHSLDRHWEPQLQAIDPSVQIRIQRPHIRPLSQPLQQP